MNKTTVQKPLLVTHIPLQAEISTSIYEGYLSRFNVALEYLKINKNMYKNFIEEIEAIFNIKKYYFDLNEYDYYVIESDIQDNSFHLLIENVKSYWELFVYADNYEILNKIYKIYEKYKDIDSDRTINYTEIIFKNGNQSFITYKKSINAFKNISADYYPFLNADLLIEYFLKGNENILILAGKPGVGKSKFAALVMKKVLEDHELYKEGFTVKTAKDINLLSMDDFWQSLKNTDLLILDDLDFLLGSRNESRDDIHKNQFINKLLSYTDGIEKSNTKIIITTNQPIDEMDNAILRKGRLFDVLNFRPLTYEEAKEIFKKNVKSKNIDFNEIINKFNLDKNAILQSDLGSIISNFETQKRMINKQEYLYDSEISALAQTKRKKVGFA